MPPRPAGIVLCAVFAATPPAAAQSSAVRPEALCAALAKVNINWGQTVTWRAQTDKPGFLCWALGRERSSDRRYELVPVGYELNGVSRDKVDALTIVISKGALVPPGVFPAASIRSLLTAVYRARNRDLPRVLSNCVYQACDGVFRSTIGTMRLERTSAFPNADKPHDFIDYKITLFFDLHRMDDDSHAVVAPPGAKPTQEEMWLIDCVDQKGGSAMVLRNCGLAAGKPSLLSISQHAEAYGRMAFASLQLGDTATALKYANQALVVDLFSAGAHNARAGVFWQQGDYQQALASITSAVELDGNSDAFLANRGNVHLALGDTRAAQADFERINVLRPDLGTGSNGIGRALERTAPDRAIKYFTQAMTLEPKNARFVLDRGICQLLAGRLSLARADVDAAFAINPREPRVLYTRGVLRRRNGDIAGGDADIAAAVALWKDVAIELNRRGVK